MSSFNAIFSSNNKSWTSFDEDDLPIPLATPTRNRPRRTTSKVEVRNAEEKVYQASRLDSILSERRDSKSNVFDSNNGRRNSTITAAFSIASEEPQRSKLESKLAKRREDRRRGRSREPSTVSSGGQSLSRSRRSLSGNRAMSRSRSGSVSGRRAMSRSTSRASSRRSTSRSGDLRKAPSAHGVRLSSRSGMGSSLRRQRTKSPPLKSQSSVGISQSQRSSMRQAAPLRRTQSSVPQKRETVRDTRFNSSLSLLDISMTKEEWEAPIKDDDTDQKDRSSTRRGTVAGDGSSSKKSDSSLTIFDIWMEPTATTNNGEDRSQATEEKKQTSSRHTRGGSSSKISSTKARPKRTQSGDHVSTPDRVEKRSLRRARSTVEPKAESSSSFFDNDGGFCLHLSHRDLSDSSKSNSNEEDQELFKVFNKSDSCLPHETKKWLSANREGKVAGNGKEKERTRPRRGSSVRSERPKRRSSRQMVCDKDPAGTLPRRSNSSVHQQDRKNRNNVPYRRSSSREMDCDAQDKTMNSRKVSSEESKSQGNEKTKVKKRTKSQKGSNSKSLADVIDRRENLTGSRAGSKQSVVSSSAASKASASSSASLHKMKDLSARHSTLHQKADKIRKVRSTMGSSSSQSEIYDPYRQDIDEPATSGRRNGTFASRKSKSSDRWFVSQRGKQRGSFVADRDAEDDKDKRLQDLHAKWQSLVVGGDGTTDESYDPCVIKKTVASSAS